MALNLGFHICLEAVAVERVLLPVHRRQYVVVFTIEHEIQAYLAVTWRRALGGRPIEALYGHARIHRLFDYVLSEKGE